MKLERQTSPERQVAYLWAEAGETAEAVANKHFGAAGKPAHIDVVGLCLTEDERADQG